ncbi:hypothetical protein HY29_07675 [Hyphomonas beringensis]|uniref:RND efflux pump membrane fusion protein barrel-sandwich domain-containing protein n=1 Tax=Hyphomonas beringensis TaxID=1280946 RepID=A0A062ULK7_9PROT|nr:efflux RND transporter periplasmic adaptor subunit [Hyphomonas beringensis]KCZ57015.1 hypothetical protein HY29_07675 [Hyphomonas beringensis]
MNKSVKIAIAIFVVILVWFAGRSLLRGSISTQKESVAMTTEKPVPEAVTIQASSKLHPIRVEAKGRTAPDKTVTVKAGTTGTVISTPVSEGRFVEKGTLLCGLDVESRAARLKEAEANRDAARVDYEAAEQLAEKGLGPKNRVTATQASLNAAEAAVNAARVELSKTQIRAPFDGIFETRLAEAGDFLSPGQACGELVDMSPVIVAVQVSEEHAGKLTTGMDARVRLASGAEYPAKLRYVSRSANDSTRTFRVEAAMETGETPVPAGITAQLFVPIGEVEATRISPGLLTLNDSGEMGLRYIQADNTVGFAPVTIIDESPQGAWVTGLPKTTQLISLGQDYLAEGVKVKPVPKGGAQP